MINDCENLGKFTPFNDTDDNRTEQARLSLSYNKNGIDTKTYDSYRQGVELKGNKYRFLGMQPKMGSGNICHYTYPNPIGQSRTFTEYFNNTTFTEKPKFSPVDYINGMNYPLPLIFNEGPQQEEVASVEPFIIPYKKRDTYSNYFPRAPRGFVQLGGNVRDVGNGNFGTDALKQFVEFSYSGENNTYDPFLDDGEELFGDVAAAVKFEGFIDPDLRTIRPFDDMLENDWLRGQYINDSILDEQYVENGVNLSLIDVLKINFHNDIRQSYGQKSATAGYDVYGKNMAKCGTDSIVYSGMMLGY